MPPLFPAHAPVLLADTALFPAHAPMSPAHGLTFASHGRQADPPPRRARRFPNDLRSPRFAAPRVFLFVSECIAFALILTGCGATGAPVARHPVAPQPVTDLAARQQGAAVVLSFTLPHLSVDGDPLTVPLTVEIFRVSASPGAVPPRQSASALAKQHTVSKTPPASIPLVETIPGDVAAGYESGGHFEFSAALDAAALGRTPGEQRAYVVRTRLSRNGDSADSNLVVLPVYPAAEAVHDLRSTVAEHSIDLTWTPPAANVSSGALPAPLTYRIYRSTELPQPASAGSPAPTGAPPPAGTPVAAAAPASAGVPAQAAPVAGSAAAAPAAAPFQLLATATSAAYSDTSFVFGQTYRYSVRGVLQFGAEQVESADSNVLTVHPLDIFPPAAPQSLVVVTVPVPAANGVPAFVELTWAISPESDLAGYAVYRADAAGTPGMRLNPDLLQAPAFRDRAVVSGRRYFYSVQAVDLSGNASASSEVVPVDVP